MERVGYRRMHDLSRISAPKFHFKSRIRVNLINHHYHPDPKRQSALLLLYQLSLVAYLNWVEDLNRGFS